MLCNCTTHFVADNKLVQCLQPSICPCVLLHGPVQIAIVGVLGLLGRCFPKNCPFPFGYRHPHVTMFLGPSPLIIPNDISINWAVFVRVPNAMLYNALSMGKKTPKTASSSRNFVTLLEEDRAIAIGNIHKKISRNQTCRSDRQWHTQTY